MIDSSLDRVLRTTKRHLQKLEQLGVTTVRDFLQYFPRTYNDTSSYTKISEITTTEVSTIKGQIKSLFNIRTKYNKKITRGTIEDDTGKIDIVWFNQPHLTRLLPRNRDIVLTGRVKYAFGKMTLQSPSYELLNRYEEQIHSGRIVPVYHETEGISSKWIREKLKPLVDHWLETIEEFIPEDILKVNQLIEIKKAVKNVHFPDDFETLEKSRERLAFNELFLLQLKVLQKKWYYKNSQKKKSNKIEKRNRELDSCINSLPFTLTNAQNRVIEEILNDLNKDTPMSRLIQGDVGSGKTVVAAIAALNVVKAGKQVAIMAPTEILAKQHYETFINILGDFGLNIQFLAGSTTEKQKKDLIRQMKTGTMDIAVGTHALIQEKVGFKDLGLAIIDEQHRFGVKQREILKNYGTPHLLSMTATPIPRTLAITIYGDQDLSIIDELPKGRQRIITRVVPENKRLQAYRWIEDQIKKGRQAFIICPLIDESDILEVKSVHEEYAQLKEHIFPNLELGLLHGRLKQDQKDDVMQKFQDNKVQILVSTSVVEVGIDVPNATIMLIEGAERFGLSQLHQFRGRVGRGQHQSYCFLFTNSLSEQGSQRISSMEKYSDGFKLSEIDLNLRGPGEIYGIKQSGIPDLKMASLTDTKTVEKARAAAQIIIDEDPLLSSYPKLQNLVAEKDDIHLKD